MNRAEKRVVIAKDVLKQLKLKRLRSVPGTYFRIDCQEAELIDATKPDVQLQDELEQLVQPCEVCALGACFVGAVRKFNAITTQVARLGKCGDDSYHYIENDIEVHTMSNYLNKFFAKKQLALIECSFEGWDKLKESSDAHVSSADNLAGSPACVAFKRSYRSPTKRMAAIMHNIVRNKGTFVLPKSCFKTSKKAS